MLVSSLLAAGAFALQTSAFLLPLEVAEAAEAASSKIQSLYNPQSTVVELACSGCTVGLGASYDGVLESERNKHTFIRLNVAIEESNTLKINDENVFPFQSPTIPIGIKAVQHAQDGSSSEPQPVGFALEVLPSIQFERENSEILPIQFTILDLNGQPVLVDTLKVDLLRTHSDDMSEGQLQIVKLSTIAYQLTPGAAECETSVCRLRAIVAARIHAMVEAAKAHANKAKTWVKGGCHGRKHRMGPGAHSEQGKGRPHGHHRHHHHMHRISHVLHQTLRFFVIPALLGVTGGLLASAVGMLVGQVIVFLWLRFFRRGHRGSGRVVEVAITEGEKDALVEDGELPPQYEDVENAVVVEGPEKKNTEIVT